ncbi:asparagine synthase (glutamine-hydrolyzing) [Francisella tularensis]|uniref:asparagine synthase (glutamine-hydrolyzing) n=2 Tax=Francisella tularensis subsp. holarctica TaxID=119857 RepID=A0AAI8BHY0_FRATH|nr:asparagine synthase (glutamine-hydrolyzing) [Francisella tularensis]AFX70298.1 asparagine synthase [Francisella tularensis subsp. holarctica F92]AHH46102.1 asparagine synthase [Francisella tularensis subsp. holarctica PHIT-FT049]EBA52257.1 asparagine synthase [Francisella tularensis subsp. holarctica 257]ABI82564.1 asparagine synthase (glutamine-hydrolyzing) [Francisella tularensis subsp. holarctica OSU18]ABU61110.1 asparagine synthase (glutamine-hydrolyzing) [Francisella tularensis subsp. 
MCGVVGFYSFNKEEGFDSIINQSLLSIKHRGSDDSGYWCDNQVTLGHTRLSIHDITNAGHQPMLSNSGNTAIVFNGEIYNYLSIKNQLLSEYSNLKFKSNSDTEVLVNAIELWGIDKTLEKCIGMFAFGVYSRKTSCLILARDRFGEKPLYFGIQNGILGFASELKALKPLKECGWRFDIDRDALAAYMRYAYVPTPYSIYKNISKLNVGSYIKFDAKGNSKEYKYWDSKKVLDSEKYKDSYDQAILDLEIKLKSTLSIQMQSDVPLGAFLSGGIDSTTVIALMQSMSKDKINTFSIGFNQKEYNEAEHARAVAKHIGTNHTDMYVTERDALDVIPKLAGIYDEPFADSSQIPTYLVSKIAKSKVTVALSGDAGDELFGGYNRYFLAPNIAKKIKFAKLLKYAPDAWIKKAEILNFGKFALLADKLLKLKRVLEKAKTNKELYVLLCSQINDTSFVLGAKEYDILRDKNIYDIPQLSFQEWMMFVDSNTYMIDDILVKVDRAAMANSLETRVPFLDHNIYEFAYSLPIDYKIQRGNGKRILKDLLYKYVPESLVNRSKMGFGIPLAKWLREDLREWADNLLDYSKIDKQGYLSPEVVQKYWQEHLSGKRNWQAILWNILIFQEWLDNE